MVGVLMAESIFPFLPNGASAPPQTFPYDVVINDAFPGIQFIPTEPNGEYQEIREVSGSLWLVTNAMWNANLLQWDQESPQNTGLPAYALSLQADGSFARYMSPATNIPLTPISWTLLFVIDKDGLIVRSPNPLASGPMIGEQTTLEFTAGSAVIVNADILFVTDVASNSESSVQLIEVNGTPIWKVRKDGQLEIGTVPYTSITGAPPPFPGFNNATFTGTTTFNGPVIENGPVQANSTTDFFGAVTAHSSLTANTTLFVAGHTTLDSVDVNTTAIFHGIIEKAGGAPVVGLSSPDSSIAVVQTGQNYTVELPTTSVGFTSVQGSTSNAGTFENYPLPGVASQDWVASVNVIVELSAPLNAGTLTITGTGSSIPGPWDSFSYTVTNPAQTIIPMSLVGHANGGDNLVMTLSIAGGLISRFNSTFVAARSS
jgi:hypothetical protein